MRDEEEDLDTYLSPRQQNYNDNNNNNSQSEKDQNEKSLLKKLVKKQQREIDKLRSKLSLSPRLSDRSGQVSSAVSKAASPRDSFSRNRDKPNANFNNQRDDSDFTPIARRLPRNSSSASSSTRNTPSALRRKVSSSLANQMPVNSPAPRSRNQSDSEQEETPNFATVYNQAPRRRSFAADNDFKDIMKNLAEYDFLEQTDIDEDELTVEQVEAALEKYNAPDDFIVNAWKPQWMRGIKQRMKEEQEKKQAAEAPKPPKRPKSKKNHSHLVYEEPGVGWGEGGTYSYIPEPVVTLSRWMTYTYDWYLWLYLLILGICCGTVSFLMDITILQCARYHQHLHTWFGVEGGWLHFLLWFGWMFLFGSASMLLVYFTPSALGSGVSEMRAIISGIWMTQYLTLRTYFTKVFSIVFALSSGLILGKLGPYTHSCAILAHNLVQFPLFHRIKGNRALYNQMLLVGCAMGAATTFGAPVGGVLFAIEMCSAWYRVRAYYYSFACAFIGAFCWRILWFWYVGARSFTPVNYQLENWGWGEMPNFALEGVLCGLLASLMIHIISWIISFRRRILLYADERSVHGRCPQWLMWISRPQAYGFLVILITSIITFPGFANWLQLRNPQALKDLFGNRDLGEFEFLNAKDWKHDRYGVQSSLAIFTVTRFIGLTLASSMPLSTGIFSPLLVFGAGFGRLYGEFVKNVPINFLQVVWDYNQELRLKPGGYAMVGAAAIVGGVTQCVSPALMVWEITGDCSYALPTILAIALSVATSKQFTINIYDRLAWMKELPLFPDYPKQMTPRLVGRYMNAKVPLIRKGIQVSELEPILKDPLSAGATVFPVGEKGAVEGYVERYKLEKWVETMLLEEGGEEERLPGELVRPVVVVVFRNTPLEQAHVLFITLRMSFVVVVWKGKYAGMLFRTDVLSEVKKYSEKGNLAMKWIGWKEKQVKERMKRIQHERQEKAAAADSVRVSVEL
eukprot:TRINITY_DN3968_c0_g1_i1.p1 TRINITY_DN3968_c0_g1~~TRINITY_DN3968_c0_g1_i1.p1  ORF type:complete len:966 (+),score=180.08 TRINITY_DN3968_c0_g1_i1:152-3049(+)